MVAVILAPVTHASSGEDESAKPKENAPDAPGAPEQNTLPDSTETGEPPLSSRIDVYLPEGRLDLRLSRLVKNALFEGQIKYDFIDGDISAFLRYRYYGYRTIYQVTLFDALEFEGVEELDNDFERVRGLLTLLEWPHDYHHRTFLLAEVDRLSSSKPAQQFSNERTNTFVRLGFQRGTPNDPRSNAIVGETRARTESLLSVHRKIGPSQAGFTAALSYSFDFLGADFEYLKLELAALKRFDLTPKTFVIGRAEGGSFLHHVALNNDLRVDPRDRVSIPRNELFRLGGRENLKGVDSDRRGTEVVRMTVEAFSAIFRDRAIRALGVEWTTLYSVFYAGMGNSGFDRDVYTDIDSYVPDVGFGLEAAFQLRDYKIFLSGLVAYALEESDGVKAHLTVRTYR